MSKFERLAAAGLIVVTTAGASLAAKKLYEVVDCTLNEITAGKSGEDNSCLDNSKAEEIAVYTGVSLTSLAILLEEANWHKRRKVINRDTE